MSPRNAPRPAAVYGVDIGKNIFHVVGLDSDGEPVQRVRFRRDTLMKFFERAAPAIVGMESCAGSQWIARRLQALGHKVRLIPAQFVKPYVKSNKSDIIDAEAIAEAATRPTMRFAAIKSEEQSDLQALHRVRDQMIGTRTRLINQMRAFCLEYGIALRQGAGLFKLDLPLVLDDLSNDLSPAMRKLLVDLFADLRQLEQRINDVTREIAAIADREDVARRLMTIPGIGALGATALLAAVGTGCQFQKARDLAAWLGLVPREYSTGGKQKLLGISKRGNRYVRKLLVHGARSCFRHLDRTRDRLGSWLDGLQSRMHPNKAVVALAAKMARIVWVVLTKPGALYERRDPAFA
ncbi:IS110 family transposase [Mesorhizobium sp. M7A.F.Ca.US.011.01.1.1]|uniref:IS110 family transposase n=1 Tax=Mesorhizobium sp. M7A.F.Ca.US.011.01.1.1 TaxID=2496741 RepID=UPI000FCAA3C6|nr:IS110 family transposase [Mesorhizobium sp. M7A.F.Ca.US.011.01.1.1]RUX22574.1 IS110 family transposase [Mesorhizobium sp. M7A.F.Ca.US.011.01.1.1]